MVRFAATEQGAEFLTSDEVIDRLLDQPRLRRQAATCVLPAVRVGSDWLFRKSDLEQWITQQSSRSIDVHHHSV